MDKVESGRTREEPIRGERRDSYITPLTVTRIGHRPSRRITIQGIGIKNPCGFCATQADRRRRRAKLRSHKALHPIYPFYPHFLPIAQGHCAAARHATQELHPRRDNGKVHPAKLDPIVIHHRGVLAWGEEIVVHEERIAEDSRR